MLKMNVTEKYFRIAIAILLVLLAISATALAGTLLCNFFLRGRNAPTMVPDNVITPEKATVASGLSCDGLNHRTAVPIQAVPLSNHTVFANAIIVDSAKGENVTLQICRNHASDSTPFHVGNMFPGDAEEKAYNLAVSYKGSVTVNFHADIRPGYEKLAEVLKCKVSIQNSKILYSGLMKDMPQSVSYTLPQSNGSTENIVYNITVYLDTSVGNAYMAQELYADFGWWVVEDTSDTPPSTTTPGSTTPTTKPSTPGELIPPKTGDDFQMRLWLAIGAASLFGILVLLVLRKTRKEEARYE